MRLIDADALIATYPVPGWFIIKVLDKAPTIKAEPVRHGRWIIENDYDIWWEKVTCSECGEDITALAPVVHGHCTFDYCPYCGAKMEEDDEAD